MTLSTNKFLYDDWNLIAETRPDNSLIRSYVWGSDLSGTSQGAGGVGGLLEISYYGSSTTNCFPAYDGNGNIMALVNAADGTVAADYEYAAFGEPIRITGVMARNNPFRFSTKYADDESDLLYYGYRYYKPSTGTWLSRDPISEMGFALLRNNPIKSNTPAKKETTIINNFNEYGFVRNTPTTTFDLFGLIPKLEIDSECGEATKKQLLEAYDKIVKIVSEAQSNEHFDDYQKNSLKALDDSTVTIHVYCGGCSCNNAPIIGLGKYAAYNNVSKKERWIVMCPGLFDGKHCPGVQLFVEMAKNAANLQPGTHETDFGKVVKPMMCP